MFRTDWYAASERSWTIGPFEDRGVEAEVEAASGLKNSEILSDTLNMLVRSTWSCTVGAKSVPFALLGEGTAERAFFNSRRTAAHSIAVKLLCWKKRIKGVVRSKEV